MTRGGTTQTRTFTYDPATQRLTQTTTPEAATVQYSYNSDGTLLSKTDALGQQTQYTYDALARVIQVSYLPNGSEDLCQRGNSGTGYSIAARARLFHPPCTTDGFGRTIRTEAGADANTILSIVDTRYAPCACSPLGKMSAVSQPCAPGFRARVGSAHFTGLHGVARGSGLRFQFSLGQSGLPLDAVPQQGWLEIRTTDPLEMTA